MISSPENVSTHVRPHESTRVLREPGRLAIDPPVEGCLCNTGLSVPRARVRCKGDRQDAC
jgi:hypothetical protein